MAIIINEVELDESAKRITIFMQQVVETTTCTWSVAVREESDPTGVAAIQKLQ